MAIFPSAARSAMSVRWCEPGRCTASTIRYASKAGFKQVEIIGQVEHDFLRFYRLTP